MKVGLILLLGVAWATPSLRGAPNSDSNSLFFYIQTKPDFANRAAVAFCYEGQSFCDLVVHVMVEVSGIDPWNAVVSGSWMHGGVRSNETFPLVLQPEHEFSLREYVPDCGVQVVGTKNLVHFQGKISSTAVPDGLCLHLDIESESGHPASAPRGSGACFKVKRKDIARSFLERAESLSVREDIKIEAKYACAADSKCVGFVAAILTATPKSFAHPVSCGGDLALWSDFARYNNASNTSGLNFTSSGMFTHWHQEEHPGAVKCGVEWQMRGRREDMAGFCARLWLQDDVTGELFNVPWPRTPGGPMCQQMVEQVTRCTVDVDCPRKPGGPH